MHAVQGHPLHADSEYCVIVAKVPEVTVTRVATTFNGTSAGHIVYTMAVANTGQSVLPGEVQQQDANCLHHDNKSSFILGSFTTLLATRSNLALKIHSPSTPRVSEGIFSKN